ncbi:MAG: TetR/AcrR family transcriptional regulator [Thermodesulfovibrionales bacterium]|nr:TetR/AcrR family transcriptional regulator [Thermodesulfovibrionales bacterium]
MPTIDTREKILKSSLRLFSQKGYIGATTREIARDACVAEVTLFRCFESKERLFEEVLNRYSFVPELEIIIKEIKQMPYEEAMYYFAIRFYDGLKSRKDIIRIIQTEVYRYPDKIANLYHSMIDSIIMTLANYFSEMQQAGILRFFDVKHAARGLMGLVFSVFNMQELLLRSKYRDDVEIDIIKSLVNIFVRGTLR